jgi:hypothetical protein
MSNNIFSKWTTSQSAIPVHIARTIYYAYINVIRELEKNFSVKFVPSQNSCYRPYAYEISRGRSGGSLHTFPAGTLGACDLITSKGRITASDLDLLKIYSPFKRICYYPNNGFVHVDYGLPGMPVHRREYYTCISPTAKWVFVGDLDDNREFWNLQYTLMQNRIYLDDGS